MAAKFNEKADKKQNAALTKKLTPAQRAAFNKADSKANKMNQTMAQDKKQDVSLVSKVKKSVPVKKVAGKSVKRGK